MALRTCSCLRCGAQSRGRAVAVDASTVADMFNDITAELRAALARLRFDDDPRAAGLAAGLAQLLVVAEGGEPGPGAPQHITSPHPPAEPGPAQPQPVIEAEGRRQGAGQDAVRRERMTEDDLYAAVDATFDGDEPTVLTVTYRRLTSSPHPFDQAQLARVLDMAQHTLADFGDLIVTSTNYDDTTAAWTVAYEVLIAGRVPLAAVALGAVAWRGTMPIHDVGLVEAVGTVADAG
jgi:hypothetical protein